MNDPLSTNFALAELHTMMLGDVRLERRAAMVLAAMCAAPAESIRSQYPTPAGAQACYRLLEHERVSHPDILGAHRNESVARSWGLPVVLAVQDTMAVSLPTLTHAKGLGPITSGETSLGYLVHTTLLVDPSGHRPLGVASQIVWARPPKSHSRHETAEQRRKRTRESEHWADGQRATAAAFDRRARQLSAMGTQKGPPPRVIAVFDREGDIFEALEALAELEHGFVIRASNDRRLTAEEEERARDMKRGNRVDGADSDSEIERRYSMTEAASGPVLGTHRVVIPRGPGRKERVAILAIRAKTMDIRPPKNRGRKGNPFRATYLDVREQNAPDGVAGLHWTLITDEPTVSLVDCVAVVEKYRSRWLIEEFHMGLKTGAGIEDRQFESLDVHTTFLAFATIVAWRLLALRTTARAPDPTPATAFLTPVQVELIRALVPRLPANPTTRDAMRAIAGFGGFMGRKGDGEPGWRTLWWGFERLLAMETGFRIAGTRSG